MLLCELFNDAEKADKKARLRTVKDLDQAVTIAAAALRIFTNPALGDGELRPRVYAQTPLNVLTQALDSINALMRPPGDVLFGTLDRQYRRGPPFPADAA